MKKDNRVCMVNRLDDVRMSEQKREIAKAYVRKVEAMLDFIWLAAGKIGSAIVWVARGRTKTATELKPGNA